MFKKEITYTDYEGKTRTEEHLFNLTKAELMKWMSTSGDYTIDKVLEKLYNEHNMKEILNTFEDLIRISYGKKSEDGRLFKKSEDIWLDFYQSPAFSEMFVEIVGDASKAAEFIKGILPKELLEEVIKEFKENPEGIPDEIKEYIAGEAVPEVVRKLN